MSTQNITEEKSLIKLSSGTSGAQIRYTINGEDPTEESTLYSNSGIELDYGDELRARAFKSGYIPSPVSYYKNGNHHIEFELVHEFDELWNGRYNSSNYSYRGYNDSNDFAYELNYINNTFFLIGFDNNAQFNTVGANVYNSKCFVMYSPDGKTWKEINLPTPYRNGSDNYPFIPNAITYYNNKYILLGHYNSSRVNDSNWTASTAAFRSCVFSGSKDSQGWDKRNGAYIYIYDSLDDQSPEEIALNNDTLNVNFLDSRGFHQIQFFPTNHRLILTGIQSVDTTDAQYRYVFTTKDLKVWDVAQVTMNDHISGNTASSNGSYATYSVTEVIYVNGKYWAGIRSSYSSSSYYYLYYSDDLLNWNYYNVGDTSEFDDYFKPIYYEGKLWFYYNNGYFKVYDITNTPNKYEKVQLINATLGSIWFHEDLILCSQASGSLSNNTTLYIKNVNTNQTYSIATPKETLSTTNDYAWGFWDSTLNMGNHNICSDASGGIYVVLKFQGTYNSTSGSTYENSWKYNKIGLFKINID